MCRMVSHMKLIPLGKNVNVLNVDGKKEILFSYQTPVAVFVSGCYLVTSKKWSRTTSKHITQWLDGRESQRVSQEEIDRLAE